ncbi:hypothetical protein L226DRAFT_378810 [Lentinus tigrinus ALCF2SS1-7]|nr:hypothetical protein L226DRAFT_378810 [Lentinus tigrinus ALCF2SS1-7]
MRRAPRQHLHTSHPRKVNSDTVGGGVRTCPSLISGLSDGKHRWTTKKLAPSYGLQHIGSLVPGCSRAIYDDVLPHSRPCMPSSSGRSALFSDGQYFRCLLQGSSQYSSSIFSSRTFVLESLRWATAASRMHKFTDRLSSYLTHCRSALTSCYLICRPFFDSLIVLETVCLCNVKRQAGTGDTNQ